MRNHLFAAHVCLAFGAPFTAVTAGDARARAVQEQPAGQARDAFAAGVEALRGGDVQRARQHFEAAAAAAPRDPGPLMYLGVLADRAGDLADAERYFATAVRLAPDSASALNNYGTVLARQGRSAEAASVFEQALARDGSHVGALVNLGQLRAKGGSSSDLEAARALFRRAALLAADAETLRSLTVLSLRLRDKATALADARAYAALAARDPASAGPAGERAAFGATLLTAGLFAEAATELAAVVALDPANADAVVLLSRAQAGGGDASAARSTLEAARARGMTAGPIHAALADLLENDGAFEGAIPAMRAAIAADPVNESYLFRYGMLLIRSKAPAAAVIRMKEAVDAHSDSAKLWFALGLAHFSNQASEEAASAFDRAIAIDPQFAAAHAYRGMALAALGDYPGALARFERALAIEPDLAVAHYLAGDALGKHTPPELGRAETHLRRAVELNPSFAPAGLALAKVYLQTNRFADAAAALERIVAREPRLAEAHYQLGRAYTRLQRTKDAEAQMAIFQQITDEDRERAVTEREDLVNRLAAVRF